MTEYEYRCFPVPNKIEVGKKNAVADAIDAYQDMINKGAEGGWEFVAIDDITSEKKMGCLGGQTITTAYKIIIFRKPR